MDTTNEIRRLILKNSSSDVIREAACRTGMRPLAEDGWRLVRLGVTTPAEVLRVTKDQAIASGLEDNAAEPLATPQ
jgi:type II secretory ATPase GspE/PulE/Tfp pilus assembly ATPase PilB-like protein